MSNNEWCLLFCLVVLTFASMGAVLGLLWDNNTVRVNFQANYNSWLALDDKRHELIVGLFEALDEACASNSRLLGQLNQISHSPPYDADMGYAAFIDKALGLEGQSPLDGDQNPPEDDFDLGGDFFGHG